MRTFACCSSDNSSRGYAQCIDVDLAGRYQYGPYHGQVAQLLSSTSLERTDDAPIGAPPAIALISSSSAAVRVLNCQGPTRRTYCSPPHPPVDLIRVQRR